MCHQKDTTALPRTMTPSGSQPYLLPSATCSSALARSRRSPRAPLLHPAPARGTLYRTYILHAASSSRQIPPHLPRVLLCEPSLLYASHRAAQLRYGQPNPHMMLHSGGLPAVFQPVRPHSPRPSDRKASQPTSLRRPFFPPSALSAQSSRKFSLECPHATKKRKKTEIVRGRKMFRTGHHHRVSSWCMV